MLYGPPGRIAVGGSGHEKDEDDEDDEHEKPATRKADDSEPVAYGAMSVAFYEDLIDCYKAKVLINLTSVDVNAAMAAIHAKVSYVGIVWTDHHKTMFIAEMLKRVFASFQDESSPMYQSELVQILGKSKNPKKVSGRVGVGGIWGYGRLPRQSFIAQDSGVSTRALKTHGPNRHRSCPPKARGIVS
jgi:hypothetical protein